jgi:acyl-coenzyme A synthetase/AMP-(fatty) acid ligase
MPKTRSGKIMRRVIAANSEVVEKIRYQVQSTKLA